MQCGPIRYRVNAKDAATARPFNHIMIPRQTGVRILPGKEQQPSIQEVYRLLTMDEQRNQLIIDDVVTAVREGRAPLLLTERTDHLQHLACLLENKVENVIVLKGGMGKKQRAVVAEKLANINVEAERVILATGRYIGEGFDDSRLDTLFLALPISWRGTLQQYAGRLHRIFDGKKEVRIYDYLDEHIPMLMRMYAKRLKGYKTIGYSLLEHSDLSRRLF
jgi:superfamily II DNA or RNA helicase